MATISPALRYHCVSIIPGTAACTAAHSLGDLRVLSADAPRLPLTECDRPGDCSCTYRHHDDRRIGPRRADEAGQLAGPWSYTDRRHRTGRRASD